MLDCYTMERHKARKDYACSLCSGAIQKGQPYMRYKGRLNSGEFFDFKYHPACQRLIDTFCSETGECEYDAESVSEWIDDEVCKNLCDIETRDDCFFSAMNCEKVLDYLKIAEQEK